MRANAGYKLLIVDEGMPAEAREAVAALAREHGWVLRCEAASFALAKPTDIVVAMAGSWLARPGVPRPRATLLLMDDREATSALPPPEPSELTALQRWPCSADDLLHAFQALLANERLTLDASTRLAMFRGQDARLTPKEYRILQILQAHQGHTVAREVLLAALHTWGQEFESNTLDVHVHRLRRKLPLADIRVERGYGYVLIPQD